MIISDEELKLPELPEDLGAEHRDHFEELLRNNERMSQHISQLSEQLTLAMNLLHSSQTSISAASRLKLPLPPKFSGKKGESDILEEE